jgi:type IV secretion system protein TrbJ
MKKTQRKQIFVAVSLLAAMALFTVGPCRAFLGFGDIVFDPSVFMQTVMGYVKDVETASNTAKQIDNQLKSLENQAKNLQSMNPTAAQGTMSQIQNALSALATVRNSVRGITMDYTKLQGAYDGVYKNFASYNGMSAKQYATQAQGILNQSNNSAYDAMRAQGLTAQIGQDSANLNNLIRASQSASGALAATQAGNQLSAVTIQQLMRLQEVLATSNRAQSSYFAAEAQKQAMANANLKRQLDLDPPKTSPLEGPGKGQGFKNF